MEKLPHKRPGAMTGKSVEAVESQGGVRTSVSTLRKCQSQIAMKESCLIVISCAEGRRFRNCQ